MDEKSTRHDIKEVLRETKVWRPLGKDSKTRMTRPEPCQSKPWDGLVMAAPKNRC